jgi:ceramide glucosyltransferase
MFLMPTFFPATFSSYPYLQIPLAQFLRHLPIGFSLCLWTGSMVYCVLAMRGARSYRRSGAPLPQDWPPVTVMRPLAGAEDNTEANLRSLFSLDYPEFEVLLSVHTLEDPATAVARRVMEAFPHVPSRLVVAGISPMPNAKVWSLRAIMLQARHELILMSDSDVRLDADCLRIVVSELSQPGIALVTCPYRAVGGPRFWSRVEALGLNTDFLAGMLTQRLLNGMDFAIGPTIGTRKAELDAIGGLAHLQKFLAEDFVMGNLMFQNGRGVILSRSVVEHHIGNDGFLKNWRHRLRWARSTRRSRPWGYVGELFTKPVALAVLCCTLEPRLWPVLVWALAFRSVVAWSTAVRILKDPAIRGFWWLLPVEDASAFVTWVLGFFGKTILWRGRELVLARDGSFESIASTVE